MFDNPGMTIYKRYRFLPAIIQYAVWLYYRNNLSHRDIEDLLAERGITVSYESIRLWCINFGSVVSTLIRPQQRCPDGLEAITLQISRGR